MVKVRFNPCDELIKQEFQKFDLEAMKLLRCTGLQVGRIAPGFQWADGMVMWRELFPHNEEMSKESPDDGPRWLRAPCAEIPEFLSSLTFKETSATIPVIDVTEKPVFSGIEKWPKGAR